MKTLISIICLLSLSPLANATTVIDAKIVRNQSGSGSCLISSGFPVPPGLVTEAIIQQGKVKVLIGGTEVAANVSALRGRHTDGTVRSILIQLTQSMAQSAEETASVIVDGGVRAYPDPAYQRPTLEIVTNNNVIVPTDKNYLVTTFIGLRGLTAEGAGSASEEKFYTALQSDRYDVLAAASTIQSVEGGASYEHVSALINLWARSANIKYQKEAIKHLLYKLPYFTPALNQSPPCNANTITNPDNRTGGQYCGLPNEPYAQWYFSFAQAYLLTGYRDFWGIVAYMAQYQQNAITSQSVAYSGIMSISQYDEPRFNYYSKYSALLPALMIDATIPVKGQYYTGRAYNWKNQLTWTIDTLEHWAWDFKWVPFDNGRGTVPSAGGTISQGGVSATLLGVYPLMHDPMAFVGTSMPTSGYLMVNNIIGGSFTSGALTGISASATGAEIVDYRYGLVAGVRANSPRGLNTIGDRLIPIFQLIFPSNFLMDTYLYFYRDSRIPDMVKTQVDVVLKNIRTKQSGDVYYSVSGGVWGEHAYVKPYSLEQPVSFTQTISSIPFELPEFARMVAFVIKTKGDSIVNGFTYTQWYEKLIDTANAAPALMTWQWKYFGQFYGWGIDAPWMMKQSSLTTYGPSILRTPTQYNAIPGDVPDVGRTTGMRAPVNVKKVVQ